MRNACVGENAPTKKKSGGLYGECSADYVRDYYCYIFFKRVVCTTDSVERCRAVTFTRTTSNRMYLKLFFYFRMKKSLKVEVVDV